MIRTGDEYRHSINTGRDIWIDGEKVEDILNHPVFKPAIDVRARIYDMAHEDKTRSIMTYEADGETNSIAHKRPYSEQDWLDKRRAVEAVLDDVKGVVTRVGDATIGEMWSLYDGRDVLNEVNPAYADNISRHLDDAVTADLFQVSANTDPKGDRSRPPHEQDPDMLLHAVAETPRGIIVRGAKYETAAAYANRAFVKPTIANWGNSELSEYALGFSLDMNTPGLKFICRSGFAGRQKPEDYPLSNRVDEVDTLVVFDDVEIPWEDVFFYQHTKAATYIRQTLHRYSAYPFVLRVIRLADMLIGTALWNVKQTGLDKVPAVQEKLARLACYREGIHAHLTAAVKLGETSPGGLYMPNQSLLYSGRILASSQLPEMMHLARELCGGQMVLTPDYASFQHPETGPWLNKFYSVNENWVAEDRRRLLAYARDLLNSDYAGHRVTFQLFAQSPPFANSDALYRSFDWNHSLDVVKEAAGLSDNILPERYAKDLALSGAGA